MQKAKMNFQFLLVLLVALALQTGPSAALAATGATTAPDHIVLTWAQDPTTTQTITWRTDTTVTNGVVKFSQLGATNANTVSAAVETLTSDLGDMYLHSVILTGLKPNTKYNYQVGDGAANMSKT